MTTMTMPNQLERNRTAIRNIRGRYPLTPARTLARRICRCRMGINFCVVNFTSHDVEDCLRLNYDITFASIYNLIRRYDGSIK